MCGTAQMDYLVRLADQPGIYGIASSNRAQESTRLIDENKSSWGGSILQLPVAAWNETGSAAKMQYAMFAAEMCVRPLRRLRPLALSRCAANT